jgi:hypothetical protein
MNALDTPDETVPLDVARFGPALRALYDDLDAAVERLAPVCAVSGRCCRFKEYDHTLFVSAAEAALLLAEAPAPARPLDDGSTCPWQDRDGRCTARSARPLGCRVFYCDPGYQPKAAELSEEYLGRLKHLCKALGLPWDYAPLHHHLRGAAAGGRFPVPAGPDAVAVPDGRTIF